MRILIITPVPTHPLGSGNAQRILSKERQLTRLGHEVHLAFIPFQQGNMPAMQAHWGNRLTTLPYEKPWKKLRVAGMPVPDRIGVKLTGGGHSIMAIDHHFNEATLDDLRALFDRLQPATAMVEYVFFSRALDAAPPGVHRVVETHDVFSSRHKKFLEAGLHPEWFFTNESEERKGLLRADAIIAIQENEARELRRIAQDARPVYSVSHLSAPTPLPPPDQCASLLYIGSNNTINAQAVRWFLDKVWPLVLAEAPELTFKIAGGVSELEHPTSQVERLGFIDDAAQAYVSSDVVVNPAQTGSGLSIKSIEALYYARPLVTTQAGAMGLPPNPENEAYRLAESAEAMAKAIISLAKKPDQLRAMSLAAATLSQRAFEQSVAELSRAIQPQ